MELLALVGLSLVFVLFGTLIMGGDKSAFHSALIVVGLLWSIGGSLFLLLNCTEVCT